MPFTVKTPPGPAIICAGRNRRSVAPIDRGTVVGYVFGSTWICKRGHRHGNRRTNNDEHVDTNSNHRRVGDECRRDGARRGGRLVMHRDMNQVRQGPRMFRATFLGIRVLTVHFVLHAAGRNCARSDGRAVTPVDIGRVVAERFVAAGIGESCHEHRTGAGPFDGRDG